MRSLSIGAVRRADLDLAIVSASNSAHDGRKPRLMRMTTAMLSLDRLLEGQMKAAAEAGFDVVMVSADGPKRPALVEREGCPHVAVAMERGLSPVHDLISLIRLVGVLRRHRPDIVHTHTPKAGLLGMMASRLCRVPVRLHTYGGLRLETMAGWKRHLMLATERTTARCATRTLSNSHSLSLRLEELKICHARVVGAGSTNGVAPHFFEPPFRNEAARLEFINSLGLKATDEVILFLGRLVRDKGIEELTEAFAQLRAKHQEAVLLLVGNYEQDLDPLSPRVLEHIRNHPRVHTLPWSEQVHELLGVATVLAHPTHREGLPNVVLQAAAAGLPIVCSDIPANLEIVHHHAPDSAQAEVFRVQHQEELAAALDTVLSNLPAARQRARQLRESIRRRFGRAAIQGQLIDLYRQELATASGSRVPEPS